MPASGRAGTAYAVVAAADTVLAAFPSRRRIRWLTKPLLMPTLAVKLADGDDDPAVRRVLLALGLCWAGDLALLAPGRRAFLGGLGSFLAAHLAYVAAFRGLSSRGPLGTAAGRAAVGLGVVAAPTMALAARRTDPRLAAPVAAYGIVLAAMVAASAAVPVERGRARILTGTSLFLLSDTLLGVQKFLLSDRSPLLESAVMATYTAGQWRICDGVTGRGAGPRHGSPR